MTPVLFYDYMLYLIGILVLFELFLLKAKARVVSIEINNMIDEALERDVFVDKAVCVSEEPTVVSPNYETEVGSKEGSEPIVVPAVEDKVAEPKMKAQSSYANITKAYDYGERKRKRLERIFNKR